MSGRETGLAEPDNLTHRLLREIRAEQAGHFEDLRSKIASLRDDIHANGKRLDSVRQMAIGESVLGRYAAAEVEERLEMRRLAALEARG